MDPGSADHYRARAASLRATAARLDQLLVLTLYQRAGTDVWIGPTPSACLSALLRARNRVLGAADEMRATARRFEATADRLGVATMAGGS